MSRSRSQDTGQFWFVLGEFWSRCALEILLEQVPKWQDIGLDPWMFEIVCFPFVTKRSVGHRGQSGVE